MTGYRGGRLTLRLDSGASTNGLKHFTVVWIFVLREVLVYILLQHTISMSQLLSKVLYL